MSRLANLSEDSVSLSEMRLKTAMKIIALKKDIENCQQLEKSAIQAGDAIRAKSLADLQKRAQIEIARLKLDAEKYQKLEKSRASSGDAAATKEASSIELSSQSIDKSDLPQSPLKQAGREPDEKKAPRSKWSVKQAMSLLGNLGK